MRTLISLGLLVLSAAPLVASEGPGMAELRALAGEWVQAEDTSAVTSIWRVTSGGSAVLETLFPGTDHEMITVYHEDAGSLMLTHYCMMGNQPRMRAVPASSERTLEFECAGGTNLNSEQDLHMHHARLEWIDADHIHAVWTAHDHGEPGHVVELDLVRRR